MTRPRATPTLIWALTLASCQPPAGRSPFGAPCAGPADCRTGACLTDPAYPSGYCTASCAETGCAAEAVCRGTPIGSYCHARCALAADCAAGYQCLDGACLPPCSASSCGAGYQCAGAVCVPLAGSCQRDADCPEGTTCREHLGGQGFQPTCQTVRGAGPGATCVSDDDCAAGTCELGVCMGLCAVPGDCAGSGCADIPRGAASHRACTPSADVVVSRGLTTLADTVAVPVPSTAVGLGVLIRLDPPHDGAAPLAAFQEVDAPDGRRLTFPGAVFQTAALRYDPAPEASAIVLPTTPEDPLQAGTYQVRAGAARLEPDRTLTPLPAMPAALEVRYRFHVADAPTLGLHLHFVAFAGYPCWPVGDGTLSAARASSSQTFQLVIAEIRRILAGGGVRVGAISYDDVAGPTSLDLTAGRYSKDLGDLLTLGSGARDHAADLFFVQGITPSSIDALSSGIPAPLDLHGTRASGSAISLQPLCLGSAPADIGRLAAHELGHQLGLWHSEEADGTPDLIADTNGADNLMYFAPRQTLLTPGQRYVLERNPTLGP